MGKEEVAKQENLPGIERTFATISSHLIRDAASSPRLAGSCAIMPKVGIGHDNDFHLYSGCNHACSIVVPCKGIKGPQLVPP